MSAPPHDLPVLASKLQPPRLGAHHVPRPRLVDRLRQYADRPLLLVCAAAGSGKTTLVAEWVAGDDRPTAWLSLDERDHDLLRFLAAVLAALQPLAPALRFTTRHLLDTVLPPPLSTLADRLSHDLAQVDHDVRLVLDDYHRLANPEIDALLLEALRHPPQHLQLVVATRTEPDWPLASGRAYGRLVELGTADLRFTDDEAATFVRRQLGEAVGDEVVADLVAQSDGWAVGLQLLTLVAARPDAPTPLPASVVTDAVRDYLFGEVLAGESPVIQARLRQLSIVERFSGALCEAVCPSAEEPGWGASFLADLERRNLFLVRYADHPPVYRFHPLFRAFLAEQLEAAQAPAQIAELHRRAAAWFAAHDQRDEAIAHALAAGDASQAGDVLARHRHELYNREQFGRLARLLAQLPAEVKQHAPELLLAEARIATINWRFSEALVFLTHAESALTQTPLDQVRAEAAAGELAVLHAVLDLWSGQADQLLAESQRALELLPAASSHLRGVAHLGVVAAYWQLGDPGQAKSYLAERLAETSPHDAMYATLLQTQGFTHWLDADLSGLATTAQRLLLVSRDLDLPDQAALAHYFLGLAHFARNDLGEAEAALSAAVAARFNLRLLWWLQAAGTLALTEQAMGRADQAQATLADARDLLLERHAVRILPQWGAFQAELDRHQGRVHDAVRWATQVELEPPTWSLAVVDPRMAQARAFLAQDRPAGIERAAELIAELRAFCARIPNRRLLLETDALAALLQDQQGDRAAVAATVEALAEAAEQTGWMRLFLDLGEPMEQLLRQLAARETLPQVNALLLEAFPMPQGAPPADQQSSLVEPLSERELEILALLGERDSNKEIAARLFIAPSTVKRHTLNIYRKLDVNGRRAAVAKAQQIGLLTEGMAGHSAATT